MPPRARALTAKQKRFCDEYMVDLNATKAALRAGYSEKSAAFLGYQLLQKTLVAQEIQNLQANAEKRTQISADWVLRNLKEVAQRCMMAVPVVERNDRGEWEPIGEWRFEHSGANKALELLGRHLGLFNDKVTHQFDFTNKSDDELLRIIGK